MERTKQKTKKGKPNKYLEKEKSSSFIADVKAFRENLKIREILKTVKMNSSMRIKAPRGSKVMQNKDFNDNEDIFDDAIDSGGQEEGEPPSAINSVLNNEIDSEIDNREPVEADFNDNTNHKSSHKSKSLSEGMDDKSDVTINNSGFSTLPSKSAGDKPRDRKLSLDQTMLLRREGLSQSELDLNSIGKSPLERKSSFFRKKMDSFARNTTEIFKRQSMSSKSPRSPITSRRDSSSSRMSVSLQSLNENSAFFEEFKDAPLDKYREQQSSVSSVATPRTDSTLSINVNDRQLEQSEVDAMTDSPGPEDQQAPHSPSGSTHSLNKELSQDSLLNTRAISMSSGLDTATGQRRRKTSRFNRVSWLASESLTDYFRRLIQDEKSEVIQGWHSYQDFSTIPENRVGTKVDSKGRRLSYMRAVSGEDSSLSSFRRKKFIETEANTPAQTEIERVLAQFSANGIPQLSDFTHYELKPESKAFLESMAMENAIEQHFNWPKGISASDEVRQEVLKELVHTEAQYIDHLKVIVDVYIASAHALQNCGLLLGLNTSTLFPHIPDILNASMTFWERAIYPMLHQAKKYGGLFDPSLLVPGLLMFSEILLCYEDYVQSQSTAVEYLRNMQLDPEFVTYLTWCNQHTRNRLMLSDILVKPMQRLTKYSLLIIRLAQNVDDESVKNDLLLVNEIVKAFNLGVNRAVRQKEEIMKVEEIRIDPYEPDFKGDDDMEKAFRSLARVDLSQPMLDCGVPCSRCLIHSGPLRYKDFLKEFEAQVLLFTDMMLICKKVPKLREKEKDKWKKEYTCWKMLRPKIMMHRIVPIHKQKGSDQSALVYVVLDEQGCSKGVFQLSESSKDSHTGQTLKQWESKIFEAMFTYTLTKWYYRGPPLNLTVIDREYVSDEGMKTISRRQRDNPEFSAVERRARERVAAMMYAGKEIELQEIKDDLPPAVIDSQDRGPGNLNTIFDNGTGNFNAWQLRTYKNLGAISSAGSSHYRSSSELHISSGGSHEELRSYSLQRSGSSIEHGVQCFYEDSASEHRSPSITVNIVTENETETLVPSLQSVRAPKLVLQQSSPNQSPGPRSASAGGSSENTLRVSPTQMVHSLPDINSEIRMIPEPKPLTASERLYRSHQELMNRNRLAAGQQHYLRPDSRGSSYPPPNPRALHRGDAVSFKYPPLTRTKNVRTCASTAQLETGTRRIFGRRSPQSDQTPGSKSPMRQRSPSPIAGPSQPVDKTDKKKSLFLRRSKESCSPDNDFEYDADDDRSRRSSRSDRVKHKVGSGSVSFREDPSSTAGEETDLDHSQQSQNKD